MRSSICVLSLILFRPLAMLWAQMEPPNEAGVSFAQWHTIVRNVKASKKFWIALGGKDIKIDGVDVVKFPGVLVFLTPGTPSGGSFGSVVNHVGFQAPSDRDAVARCKAMGLTAEYTRSVFVDASLGWAYSPDDLKVEITSDKSLSVPIANPDIHFWVVKSAMAEMQAWYVKTFGGKPAPGTYKNLRVAGIPGLRVTIVNSEDPPGQTPLSMGLIHGTLPAADSMLVRGLVNPPAPTKGRTLDHVGFDVAGLEAFCKKLETNGVKFDRPFSRTRHKSFASAEFTDPWGTSIELTEGLNRF